MAATNLIRGYAAFLQGRFDDARDLVLVAAEMAEKTGLIPMAARAQRQLATIAANAGDAKLAATIWLPTLPSWLVPDRRCSGWEPEP
jgi:hypothetical protein